MYPDEGSDHSYTMGKPSLILVDEYWTDDERVWLRFRDEDEMVEHYGDIFFDDLFPEAKFANDEQEKEICEKVYKFLESQNWKKCICVYIRP